MAKPLSRRIIERARDLIADEAHWCRGALAMDARGVYVCPTDPAAIKYCAMGALIAAAFEISGAPDQAQALAYSAERLLLSDRSLVAINDGPGHAEVLDLLEATLAAL